MYNPKSGNSVPLRELKEKCGQAKITIDTYIALSSSIAKKLKPHLKNNTVIIVIGGDGTVSAVAAIVAGSKAVVAPLPGGTLNHFTKDLGIPQNIDAALMRLHDAQIHSVDIAEVNGNCFINNSSIGLYPWSLRLRENMEPQYGKWLSIVFSSLKAFVGFYGLHVEVDGEKFRTPFIFVGNNQYDIDMNGGIRRDYIDMGTLSIFVAKTQSRLALLKGLLTAVIGKSSNVPEFESHQLASYELTSRMKKISVSIDGEKIQLISPLRYEIKPAALNIL